MPSNYPFYIFPLVIALCFLALFFVFRHTSKSSLFSGFFFACFLLFCGIAFLAFAAISQVAFLQWVVVLIGLFASFVLVFGIYVFVVLLLLNARLMFKRERRTFANSLTLLLSVVLIVHIVFSFAANTTVTPYWVQVLDTALWVLGFCYFAHIFIFLTTCLLCNISYKKKNQDYIIILGSGLVNGTVSPLLAARIDKAISFYHKQKEVLPPPVLLFSGGQGADESTSEAAAMAAYAIEKGIPEKDILTETKSTNTAENMRFSKEMMDARSGENTYHSIYSTSNYHVLRAGIYAQRAGLNSSGIGAKTAWYYLPNALLREYIAYLKMYWKQTIFFTCAVLILTFLFLMLMRPYL